MWPIGRISLMRSLHQPNRFLPYVPLLFLCLLAITAVMVATRWGVALSPDSLPYFSMTRSLFQATGFGPGYPLMLKPFAACGMDLPHAAKVLNLLVLCALLVSVYLVIYRSTGSILSSSFGTYLVAISTRVLEVHISALSDAPFVLWTFLCLSLLARYLETDSACSLVGSAICGAMAIFTRFAGAPLVAVGLFVLLARRRSWPKKLWDCTVFTAIGVAPLATWCFVNIAIYGQSGAGREAAFLGNPDAKRFIEGAHSVASYLLPSALPAIIRYPIAAIVIATLLFFSAQYSLRYLRSGKQDRKAQAFESLPYVLLLFLIFYPCFLLLSILVEANLPLYWRYMAPLYVAAIPLAILVARRSLSAGPRLRTYVRGLVLFATVLAMSHTGRAVQWCEQRYEEGSQFSSRSWQDSPLLAYVRGLNADALVYTNGHDAIELLTGRHVKRLPEISEMRTGLLRPEYTQEIAAVRKSLEEEQALIVYFDTIDWRSELPSRQQLERELPISIKMTMSDGVVYDHPASLSATR
jgi:hypothetical protein